MQKSKFIWLNGKFSEWNKAKVHFLTHSLHYGSAVFEGIRCYKTPEGPAVFRLKDHLKRFFFSAKVFGMKIPFGKKELHNAIIEVIKKNGLEECYIRPIAFYGYGQMGLNPIGAKINVGIAAWKWGTYFGREGIKYGVRAKVSEWVRPPANMMPTNAKVSGNYVNSILAKIDAVKTGYDEAILLDKNRNVAECTGENIFIAKDNKFFTPPTENILKGITRDSVMQIAKDSGIKVREEFFEKEKLYGTDEVFLTGTATEITPVKEIDKKKIGNGKPGPLTRKVQDEFSRIVHGKVRKYRKWLVF